jgi:NAD(P)-dependent dehydrogenase (short-subunit alcohol dehydrogenase family)
MSTFPAFPHRPGDRGRAGIGRACALALIEAGWTVVLAGRQAEALEAVAEASAAPERACPVVADVRDEASVKALFAVIHGRFGRLDFLFNNAGIFTAGVPLEDLPWPTGRRRWTST